MSPPSPSTHVAKTTDAPSGVKMGDVSTTVVDDVTRRGAPPPRSITYTFPKPVNATRRPSGESDGSRISRTTTESPTVNAPFTKGPSDCSTSAENGIWVSFPDGTSTRHNLPRNDVTIARPSGVHAELGSGPTPVDAGAGPPPPLPPPPPPRPPSAAAWPPASGCVPMTTQRSPPVWRSRMTSPNCDSNFVKYASVLPSRLTIGRKALPG